MSTKQGKVGYKLVKLELFPNLPGTSDYESIVKIHKKEQSTVATSSGTVDLTDNSIIGVSLYTATSTTAPSSLTTIMDVEVVNQDIFVSHTANSGSASINYYIELETIDLSDSESTQITLKNLRTVASRFT